MCVCVCVAFLAHLTQSNLLSVCFKWTFSFIKIRATKLRRNSAMGSLATLNNMGFNVEDQLARINECLENIDRPLLPSTINNYIYQRFVLQNEREIISIFADCDARALNYLVGHVKLALLFYKVKDHRTFDNQNRTQLVNVLAADRLSILTVESRVIVLHSLQLLKLKANPKAENWVKNIILNTTQDDLSTVKTLMDSKGDYFCMTKLIYNDLKSDVIRDEILAHIRKEAAVLQAHRRMGTKKSKKRKHLAWRKILSDVDDTLLSSGGSYPAGVDKRYAKKVVYPGVLGFYREMDLGTQGPDEWPEGREGNLVFLSARPHVYKDMSEKANFKKFEKMRATGGDGKKGMHATPSLLAGDIASGTQYIISNNFESLAVKKFDNFKRYVSIYPEYTHVFVADNGQGDVRAGDMMFDKYPYELEAMYVHVVQDRMKTHGYDPAAFRKKGFFPCYFTTYPEAALHAATVANPPQISMKGLRRICCEANSDFQEIPENKWATIRTKAERRQELNQALWRANFALEKEGLEPVSVIEAEQLWMEGQMVRTPYGIGTIVSFNPLNNLYEVDLDWRPLNVQLAEHLSRERNKVVLPHNHTKTNNGTDDSSNRLSLETVVEIEEIEENAYLLEQGSPQNGDNSDVIVTPSHTGHVPSAENIQKVLAKLPSDQEVNGTGTDASSSATIDRDAGKDEQGSAPSDVKPADSKPSDDKLVQGTRVEGNECEETSAKSETKNSSKSPKVKAFVAGHQITSFTPPVLPKLEAKGSMFTFWSPSGKSKKHPFNAGVLCSTQYGNATVVEYRPKQQVVVVDMIGWTARASLREEDVKIASKGLIRSLFRKVSGHETAATNSKVHIVKEFPHVEGTHLVTPYGKGKVTKPLPQPKPSIKKKEAPAPTEQHAVASQGSAKDVAAATTAASIDSKPQPAVPTIGISLTSWTLADGSHPVLYSTVDTAQTWKDQSEGEGIISATVNLVSKTLLGPFRSHQNKPKKEEAPKEVPKEEQYYQLSSAVDTHYGIGIVSAFRPEDGFYAVSLSNWTLSDGSHPVAFLKKDDIKVRIAQGCQEGYPVYTKLGLTGTLASVQPKTGKLLQSFSTRKASSDLI